MDACGYACEAPPRRSGCRRACVFFSRRLSLFVRQFLIRVRRTARAPRTRLQSPRPFCSRSESQAPQITNAATVDYIRAPALSSWRICAGDGGQRCVREPTCPPPPRQSRRKCVFSSSSREIVVTPIAPIDARESWVRAHRSRGKGEGLYVRGLCWVERGVGD